VLAAQGASAALQVRFEKLAETRAANEARINAALIAAQWGKSATARLRKSRRNITAAV
jgi:monomeric isocitrate dehydrogenase